MRKSQILILVLFGWFMTACTGSGFSASSQDGKASAPPKQAPVSTVEDQGNEILVRANAPSPVLSLGGVLVSNNSSKPQIESQIHINVKAEQVSIKNQTNAMHLDKIEDRNDFVQYGCDRASSTYKELTKDLIENKNTGASSGSLAIKAKLVLFCGKVLLPEAFVTIAADHFVLIGANYEPTKAPTVGFFNALVNELTLVGTNQMISKGTVANGIAMEGPSISLVALKALNGKGTLDLRTVGGDIVAEGGK